MVSPSMIKNLLFPIFIQIWWETDILAFLPQLKFSVIVLFFFPVDLLVKHFTLLLETIWVKSNVLSVSLAHNHPRHVQTVWSTLLSFKIIVVIIVIIREETSTVQAALYSTLLHSAFRYPHWVFSFSFETIQIHKRWTWWLILVKRSIISLKYVSKQTTKSANVVTSFETHVLKHNQACQ